MTCAYFNGIPANPHSTHVAPSPLGNTSGIRCRGSNGRKAVRRLHGQPVHRLFPARAPEGHRRRASAGEWTGGHEIIPRPAGGMVRIRLPELPDSTPEPEDIAIEVVLEDDFLTVVNEPPGMATHPAKGNWRGTLVNALQSHCDTPSTPAGENRPGIVNRLDRETTGMLVVFKDEQTHRKMALQFELRQVHKEYLALVSGVPQRDSDDIEQPIGFHPTSREKVAIRAPSDGGKDADTFYEDEERFKSFALVRCKPKTGRTHQIRIHLTHIGHPVLADKPHSGRDRTTLGRAPRPRAENDPGPARGRRQIN